MISKKNKVISIIKYIIISLLASIIVVLPVWILLVNSFKLAVEAKTLGLGLPEKWNIVENYSTVIFEGRLLRFFFNSLVVTVSAVILIILVGSLAAWVLARKKAKYISIIYFFCIFGLLIPPAIVTTIRVLRGLHLYDSYLGLILFYTSAWLPFVIFLTTGFIKNIPRELEEAARIDGANPVGIFFKIVFPLLQPVRLSSLVFVALFIWNDFLYPFYFINRSSLSTIQLGLYYFISKIQRQVRWELVFADVILVSLPLIIVFIFAQKKIVSGIMGGSLKQ